MWKLLYVLCRNSGFFSLPVLSRFRDFVYARHLVAQGISVDSFVRIQKLHSSAAPSRIGSELHVGYGAVIDLTGGADIGDRVTVSEGARIFTHSHPVRRGPQDWRLNPITYSRLTIGDDAWIASNVVVLESVSRIGVGAIVSAGSVVTKDVADFEIIGGVPAKSLGKREVDAPLQL